MKTETPKTHDSGASMVQLNINFDVLADKDKHFTASTQKVYDLLASGGKYSVVELTTTLGIPDPRSCIRDLRNNGIPISDYWVKTTNSRYKVYFLK